MPPQRLESVPVRIRHLPRVSALSSGCTDRAVQSLTRWFVRSSSLFATFVGELFAYRFGVAHFAKVGIDMDGRGCGLAHSGHQAATPAEIEAAEDDDEDVRKVLNDSSSNDRHWRDSSEDMPGRSSASLLPSPISQPTADAHSVLSAAGAQILGCAILEAGILFVRTLRLSLCFHSASTPHGSSY